MSISTSKAATTVALGLLVLVGPARAEAAARVELELVMQGNFPLTSQQQWYKLLTELKVDNLQIRKAGADDKVEVKVSGSESNPVYRVRGMLTGNNELVVPGERFSSRDRARLAQWLKQLRENGPEPAKGQKSLPFGLAAKQLAAVHEDLAHTVDSSTKDLAPAEAVAKIASDLSRPLVLDAAAKAALQVAEPVREDLAGLSSGTALAYLLRPAGLVYEPRTAKQVKKIEYVVYKPIAGHTPWPVGWPPEVKPAELVPDLMETLNEIEIDETLAETLAAIGERLGAPILYDHVALARQGVDPYKAKVSLNGKQWWYGKIIDKIMFKAKLKGEWRVDEAGKPLLWVTTYKKVK
jgi:hypothetical protein